MKRCLLFVLLLSLNVINLWANNKAVTYEFSGGRFGDNLMSYFHAKWIAYKYDIDLLINPFTYSHQLKLYNYDKPLTPEAKKKYEKRIVLGRNKSVNMKDPSSILYIVPYFPESLWEQTHNKNSEGKPWDCFTIDWEDKGFIKELKKVIQPKQPINISTLPSNYTTVAVHIRKGGYHDTPVTFKDFPLKFIPESFYFDQIERLYTLLNKLPLYIYLFTDDPHPIKILNRFEKHFNGYNIKFDCRRTTNHDQINVLEDFFALMNFDCLIHSESLFSVCASKLIDYQIRICPNSVRIKDGRVIIDKINTVYGKKKNSSPYP